jgi:hypothetical protein
MSKEQIADKFIINLVDFIEFTSFLFDEYKSHFDRIPTSTEYTILINVIKNMNKHSIVNTFIPKVDKEQIYQKISTKNLEFFKKNQQYMNCLPKEVSEFININKIIQIIDKKEYIDVFWDYLNSFVKLSIKYESAS